MAEIIQKALAAIEEADSAEKPHGGFIAVLSTPSQDRDGDQLARNEWLEPLPDRIPIDVDHEMSVRGTVGSGRPYFDEHGRMMLDVDFASTPQAQEVRTLVKEGHIGAVSVAFLTDKSKKDGVPRRELLNAGIVAIPSNRDAVILSAKEFAALKAAAGKEPYGPDSEAHYADPGFQPDHKKRYPLRDAEEVRAAWDYIHHPDDAAAYTTEQRNHIEDEIRKAAEKFGVTIDDSSNSKSVIADVITKASQAEGSLIQGIHDAAAHLGAVCAGATEPAPDPDDGSDDGANKSADLSDFNAKIDALTKSSGAEPDQPADDESAPADAASEAASDKEPAEEPADAAVDESKEAAEKQISEMLAHLLISSIDLTELDF